MRPELLSPLGIALDPQDPSLLWVSIPGMCFSVILPLCLSYPRAPFIPCCERSVQPVNSSFLAVNFLCVTIKLVCALDLHRWQIIISKCICCYCSVAKSCLTLCNPTDCSMPGFPILNHLLEFPQIHVHWVSDAIQPSHSLQGSSYTTILDCLPTPLFVNRDIIRVNVSTIVAILLYIKYFGRNRKSLLQGHARRVFNCIGFLDGRKATFILCGYDFSNKTCLQIGMKGKQISVQYKFYIL